MLPKKALATAPHSGKNAKVINTKYRKVLSFKQMQKGNVKVFVLLRESIFKTICVTSYCGVFHHF